MKIGIVLDDTLDSTDGIQQYVVCLGEWLKQRGHTVHYLVGETSRTDLSGIHSLAQNVQVSFNGNRLSIPRPVSFKRLRTLLDDVRLDVLHVQTPYSPFLGGRLIRCAADDTAVVGTFHILPYGKLATLGSDILGKINTSTAKRFDAMMATSHPAKEFAGKHYGFTSAVVANPFHHDAFSSARKGKIVPRTIKRILFMGRLVERKGALELLQAVDYMQTHGLASGAYQVIVGGKGPQLPKLQHFTRDHNLTDVVSFPGFIAEAEKPKFLARADITVFPSLAGESFGISLLEGMAASRGAVLAGNNPGYASVVAERAQLFDPRDTAGFAALLSRWLSDDAARRALAQRQHTHVAQFDIDVIGPKIERIYETALQKRRKA